MSEPTQNLPVPVGHVVSHDEAFLGPEDQKALEKAVKALEHTNLATRFATVVGKQLGTLSRYLPLGVSGFVNRSAEAAIKSALTFALRSMKHGPVRDSRRLHKIAATFAGAAGGTFGLSSLPIELPVSTIIIMRSIADIAREEGEDLSDPEVALACLQVFALGARDTGDDYTESGYFAVRSLFARTVSEASRYMLTQGLTQEGAPVLVRLVSQIGARFGFVVSEKLAAQAVPVVGAAGGAAINYAFAEHFQSLAFGHFTVRRLERLYGASVVKKAYDHLLKVEKAEAYA